MNSNDRKKFLANYCIQNKNELMKKWLLVPPPPTDENYENFCKYKSWKRQSRKKNKDGDFVRTFVSCCCIWYDKGDTGFPVMLKAKITERGDKIIKIDMRKW